MPPWPLSSMRSFAFVIEPDPLPRLAAGLTLLHAAAASLPWIARCPAPLSAALTLLAIAGFMRCLADLPGRHCVLQSVAAGPEGWRIRLQGETAWRPATLTKTSRAVAAGALLELRSGGRRVGWLLPRQALPAADFRRLRARIRLSC